MSATGHKIDWVATTTQTSLQHDPPERLAPSAWLEWIGGSADSEDALLSRDTGDCRRIFCSRYSRLQAGSCILWNSRRRRLPAQVV